MATYPTDPIASVVIIFAVVVNLGLMVLGYIGVSHRPHWSMLKGFDPDRVSQVHSGIHTRMGNLKPHLWLYAYRWVYIPPLLFPIIN